MNVMAMLLVTLVILPFKWHASLSDSQPVEIDQFSSNQGIYFEGLGMKTMINNEWNLVVYYDPTNYWKEL